MGFLFLFLFFVPACVLHLQLNRKESRHRPGHPSPRLMLEHFGERWETTISSISRSQGCIGCVAVKMATSIWLNSEADRVLIILSHSLPETGIKISSVLPA